MNPITQGLIISGLGLLITFIALGILILVIIVLQRLFPGKPEPVEEEAPQEPATSLQVEGCAGDEMEIAAAIAVAIQVARSQQANLGAALSEGRGSWWYANRATARQVNLRKN